MIQPDELMLDALLLAYNEEGEPIAIVEALELSKLETNDHCIWVGCALGDGESFYHSLEGIPLTEKWLLNCKQIYYGAFGDFFIKNCTIISPEKEGSFLIDMQRGAMIELNFVHELQRFASFFGIKLEFDLKKIDPLNKK
jgi:hypothetical protein